MNWDQPTALWLLLTILLLLFATRTTPRQRLAVGSLFLWADLESRQSSALSSRLRRHWLLILQAAFIAVVVVALARPLVSFGAPRLAIVLDTSLSMGATDGSATRLEAAKARAASLVQALPRGGRATIWLAGAEVAALGEFRRADASLSDALQPLRATDAATDLEVAIDQVRSADPTVSRIHVVSDTPPPDLSSVDWSVVGAPADNVALTTVEARRLGLEGPISVLVGVRNYGGASISGEIAISQSGSVVARRTLHLTAGQEASVVFDLTDLEGVVVATLDLPDALAADNTRFTVVGPPTPLLVRLIGRNHWVEQALAVNPDVLIIDDVMPRDGGEREPDVVVCASCDDIPSAAPRASVLLVPPPLASPRAPSAVIVTNATHPLMRGLNADGALVSPSGADGSVPAAEVLAHAGTLPVIIARDLGQRRVVELRVDPSASDIVSEPTFPLLMANAVEWLGEPQRRSSVLTAGEPLRYRLPDEAGGAVVISGPDGRVMPARRAGSAIVAGDTATAGIYQFTAGDRDVEFVVNPAVERESDLSGTHPIGPSLAPADLAPRPTLAGMTQGLLLAALAVLVLEWRHRTRRRGR